MAKKEIEKKEKKIKETKKKNYLENIDLSHGTATYKDERNKEYSWFVDGKCHRLDGPAIIDADGSKYWLLYRKRHREDGPAIEDADGSKCWYLNGKCHREDGPAVEYANGSKAWYLDGKLVVEYNPPEAFEYMQKKFERLKREFYTSQVVEG